MDRRHPSMTPDEIRVWEGWRRLGLVGVPWVSFAWVGGGVVNRGMKWTVNELRGHMAADHGGYLESTKDYVRLKREHDARHLDPLWSHVLLRGDRVHVHEDVVKNDDTPDGEWTW